MDQGNDLQRRGTQGHELADQIDQAIDMKHDDKFAEEMDLIKNHLRRAWHIEASYLSRQTYTTTTDRCRLARAERLFVEQAVDTLYSLWLRDKAQRRETEGTTSSDDNSTNSTDAQGQGNRSRSRSPAGTPRTMAQDDATSLMEKPGADTPMRKRSPTRLWKELPADRKSSEVRRLQPPWKKNNNPPLQTRGPRQPSTSPPRGPPKAKPRPAPKCTKEIPAPRTPTTRPPGEGPAPSTPTTSPPAEETEPEGEQGALHYDDAIATWQAIFEMQPNEGLEEAGMPVLPQSIADSIVETLADKPAEDHQTMVDAFPAFMGRLQQDVSTAMARARDLRQRLSGAGSSTDRPEVPHKNDREDDEESIYMQTSLDFAKLSKPGEDTVLARLQRAFDDLDPGRAASRAIKLAARLQDHEGTLLAARAELEALLITYSVDTPPAPTGEEAILEFCWVGTWWRRLTGQQGQQTAEVDANLQAYEAAVHHETAIRNAEEAHQDTAEQQYLRGLEAAIEHHQEQIKAEHCQREDDQVLKEAMGLTWEPPKKRLCIGICVTDGRTTKAWDWELDRGAEVQVHIKATKKECPGQWFRDGQPLPAQALPPALRTALAKDPPIDVQPKTFDLQQQATAELYRRWCGGLVSDQAVVTAGNTDMLAHFKQIQRSRSDAMETHLQAEQASNTAASSHAHPLQHQAADGAHPDGHGEQTVSSEPSVMMVGDTVPETADEELESNPSTYYNGRRWADKYGHPDSSDDKSD